MIKWSEKNIVAELKKLCVGQNFPTASFLEKSGRSDLRTAMIRNGGILYYKKLLGFNLDRKPPNYWRDNYKLHVKNIVDKLSRFPTQKELLEIDQGLSVFLSANGLLGGLREKYGYKSKKQQNGFWGNFDNIKNCILFDFEGMVQKGVFPTRSMIKGGSFGCALSSAIDSNGGISVVAAKMECKPKTAYIAPDGHYLDSTYELMLDWYLCSRGILHCVHGKICEESQCKFDFKVSDFYIEIWGFSGSDYEQRRAKKEKLYKEVGLNLISIEASQLNKPYGQIENYFDELFRDLGFDVSRKSIGEIRDSISGVNYWDFNNTLKEIEKITMELSHFPTVRELKKIGKGQVQNAMQKHGGQSLFREKLQHILVNKSH